MVDLIYRLETKGGDGVYGAGLAQRGVADYWGIQHPSPYSDGIDRDHLSPFIFGFETQTAAQRWFHHRGDLRDWAAKGLWLAIWPQSSSREILRGYRQIAFRRPDSDPLYLAPEAIHTLQTAEAAAMALDYFGTSS